MSNECKDYLWDKIAEVALDSGAIDRVEDVNPASYFSINTVTGLKNNQRVTLSVWFDNIIAEWKVEHRESI